jgi:putative membrane protein
MARVLVEFAIRWVILAIAVWVASLVVGGIQLEGLASTLAVALVLGLLNLFVKPILVLFSAPILLITLGLFLLIINTLLLLLGEWLIKEFTDLQFDIDGFWSAFLGALIISIVSFIVSRFIRADRIARNLTS